MSARPPSSATRFRRALFALIAFVALGGIQGGILILRDPTGARIGFPPEMIHQLPVSDYTWPGLFLLLAYGGGGGLTLWALWSRKAWAARAAMGYGLTLVLWMITQLALIGLMMPVLQPVMLLIGFGILLLALR
jgi:hypothetical protein